MAEQALLINTRDVNGRQYKNINLKTKAKTGEPGIEPGNFIVVKKSFVEGRPNPSKQGYGISYSCGAEYGGEKVSFWLNEAEHEVYRQLGGVGDDVKISLTEETRINKKGQKLLVQVLSFELV